MTSLIVYFGVFIIGTYFICKGTLYKNTFNILCIIGILILIIFAAGRYHVGTDMNTYMNIFTRYSSYTWSEFFSNVDGDLLYAIIAKITYSLGGRVLTWGTFATLIILPVYIALRKQYPEASMGAAFFAFLCFYFSVSFNITRQFIAVAIIFWGLKFVFQNRLILFLIVIAVATGFHASAPIAFFVWFLWDHRNNCPINGYRKIILLVGVAVIVLLYQYAIEFVANNIDALSSYATYAETSTHGRNRDLYLYLLELIALLLLKKYLCEDEKIDFMYCLLIISVMIGFTGFLHPQVKRMAYYFSLPSRLVLFGNMHYAFTENSRIYVKLIICVYVAAVFVLTAYILGESNLIPYRFDLFSEW